MDVGIEFKSMLFQFQVMQAKTAHFNTKFNVSTFR